MHEGGSSYADGETMMYRGKRALDIALGAPALLLSLPVQAIIGILVRRGLGSPVLFLQTRPGLNGRPFELIKFRTMRPVDEAAGHVSDDERMTPLGLALRSTSLDELPTLWNVVRGDMSLVGPRPLLMHYLPRYTPQQGRRHEVRPGLTGWAQVNGRNAISWEQKLAYDVEYVDSASLRIDLRIIGRTLKTVLRREGVAATGSVTMPEFLGKDAECSGGG